MKTKTQKAIAKDVQKVHDELLSAKRLNVLRDRILANQYFVFNNPDDQDVKNLKASYIAFQKMPHSASFSVMAMEVSLTNIEAKRIVQ